MKSRYSKCALLLCIICSALSSLWAGDAIPKIAWQRGIGVPLANAGTRKAALPDLIDDGYWQGAPVGGFGSGTFSRTYRGDFSRWHLKAGIHKYETVYANQFAIYEKSEGASQGTTQVLLADHPKNKDLNSWKWDYPVGAGNYYALYPKSWYDYRWDKLPAHVTLEQFSPVLPDNYRESSYPVAVYRWHADNPTDKPVTVSVLLSWANMVGWFRYPSHDFAGQAMSSGNYNSVVSTPLGNAGTMKSVVFDRIRPGEVQDDWDGQFAISSLESPGVEITYQNTFIPDEFGGDQVWAPFSKDGRLANDDFMWISSGETLAGAIAVRFTLQPGEKRIVPMVISWDLPLMEFGTGRKWYRHYTDFFGTSGKNALKVAGEGLTHAAEWSDAIDAWQAPYVNDESKPAWYRSELFNELYVLTDGGSLWGRPVGADPKSSALFSFLECYDYPYYSTLDVRFSGSMPLVKFWPDLDKQEMRTFAETVLRSEPEKLIWNWKTEQDHKPAFRTRKSKGAVPHDLGAPEEDPFFKVNQFSWQNTDDWKDLNPKFVLMVYRDYVFTGRKDTQFLRDTWPSVQLALDYLRKYDRNGDGIPENDGFPDQTYDVWVVRGESAYCGGLWLAALRAAEEIAKTLNDPAAQAKYHDLFVRSQASYIKKLWNGEYFLYDTGSEYRNNIQADQLAGQWYAHLTGLGDIVPMDMQRKALKKIFNFNVMKFAKGEMGAINGIEADGTLMNSNEQVREVWGGTTFSLAALMLADGLKEEGYRTAWGVYHVVYETKGYWFRTPEAYEIDGNFRASMYMRPAAIWAMEMTEPPAAAASAAGK
ncbi:MAG: glucosylceramidase [Acidobacteriia bacterium]|nr:glucosylceramidase [Terriglobia bacterium]